MLDPLLLRLFVHLAEERHFGRAAERSNLAQSTASMQLMRLEDAIGAPLFTRRKRAPVRLTEVGELFLIEARAVLDRLARAETVGRAAARPRGAKRGRSQWGISSPRSPAACCRDC